MKMIKLLKAFTFFAVLIGVTSTALTNEQNEAASRYNKAGGLYRNGDFIQALEIYEDLIGRDYRDPDLFYNASNAAYRNKQIGKAILYLEKARRMAPSDEDIRANLTFLNSVKIDKETTDNNPVTAFIVSSYERFNRNAAALWSGLFFLIGMEFFTAFLFVRDMKRMVFLTVGIAAVFLSTVSTVVLIEKSYRAGTVAEAVIMDDEVLAYSGPGVDNTHIFTIHEGTKVTVERNQNKWSLIRLKSGSGGWVQTKSISAI